jgi:dCMP deaminase
MNVSADITWSQYFMAIAMLSAKRSKDPNTKVGACIVNDENKIVGIGYNGMPIGCDDSEMPWGRSSDFPLNTKYPFVVQSELNAILNSIKDIKDCTLYVTLFPCNECAKAIIQSGIKKVVYYENKYPDSSSVKAAEMLFRIAKVEVEEYKPLKPPMDIVLEAL